MPILTIRPDAITYTYGTVSNIGGAASLVAAISDNSDGTYARFTAGGQQFLKMSFTNPVIPANSFVKNVTPRIRNNRPTTPNNYSKITLNYASSGGLNPSEKFTGGGGSFATWTGSVHTLFPWTQANLDSLVLEIEHGSTEPQFDVSEVYLDIEYNQAPSITAVSTPTGVQATTRPTVSWTYTDPEGDQQTYAWVKIFSAAQYGAGGFNPETSTATWDSGWFGSVDQTSVQVATDLINGTSYRAYVKIADSWASGPPLVAWSNWSYSSFSVSITPPNTPTLSVSASSTTNRNTLTISASNNYSATATDYHFEVERSDDGGVTWNVLKRLFNSTLLDSAYRSTNYAAVASPSVTLYDYEAPRGITLSYRVRALVTASGNSLVSAYSTVQTPSVLALTKWYLKSLTLATANITLNVHSLFITWESEERQIAVQPLGRANLVVLSDVIGGEYCDIELSFTDEATYTAFKILRKRQEVMLLQSTTGDHRYVRFGPTSAATHMLTGGGVPKRIVKTQFIEQDAP